jgi:hypothetical protein
MDKLVSYPSYSEKWHPFRIRFGDYINGEKMMIPGYFIKKGNKVDNTYLFSSKKMACSECSRKNAHPNQLDLLKEEER